MPTPPVIDVEALLEPISPEEPAGKNLFYEPEYSILREARRSEDATLQEEKLQGDWGRDIKTADWDLVLEVGQELLRTRTKDLQIAAWVTEALGKIHGFAGLREGFRLLHGIQEKFWTSYFPEIDDGDLDSRIAPFLFLNDPRYVPFLVHQIPLTQGIDSQNFPYSKYAEGKQTDNEIRKNAELEGELLGEGRITLEMFKIAVSQTPKAFYVHLAEDIKECFEALKTFEKSTDERFGKDAPSLLDLTRSVDECRKLIDSTLAEKRKLEPDAPPPSPGGRPGKAATGASASDGMTGLAAAISAAAASRPGHDAGQILISFLEGAQELSEIGNRLKENREKHAELLGQLKELDAEYKELSLTISRNQEYFELLTRMNMLRGGASRLPTDVIPTEPEPEYEPEPEPEEETEEESEPEPEPEPQPEPEPEEETEEETEEKPSE